MSDDPGIIYLVHFERPFRHARHYLGWTSASLPDRFERHRSLARKRRGSALLRAVMDAGIPFKVVKTWPGDRKRERGMKTRGHARECPVCRGKISYDAVVCPTRPPAP